MSGVFVSGAHTDVGKTYVACALVAAARAAGRPVTALKPVVSGFDAANWAESDPGRLLAAMGVAPSLEALEAMSPWRFAAPLAPPMAARREGRTLALDGIVDVCRRGLAEAQGRLAVVEGVGGLMSPLAEDATGLDLMTALRLPTILVGGSYLGGISHTLTALTVARAAGLEVRAVVVSESGDPEAPDLAETAVDVRRFGGGVPVIVAARGEGEALGRELLALV